LIDHLLRLAALGFQRLPEAAALRLGRRLGLLWHDVVRYRRGVALAGLAQAFPDLPVQRREALCRENFAHYGLVLAEFLRLPALSDAELLARVDIEGVEHVERARARGRGLLVLFAHTGNWELLAAVQAALGLGIGIVTQHAHQEGVDRYWQRTRRARGLRFFDSYGDLHRIMRHLRGGGAVGLAIDQNEGGTTGARVPFFGRESGTVKAPALLSARLGAPVIMALTWRDQAGRHQVRFSEELPLVVGDDLAATVERTTRSYNALLEAFIREHPEQWTWVHRRWKAV
jgi:KDO2-lipid IV(A) lauroyltransferase